MKRSDLRGPKTLIVLLGLALSLLGSCGRAGDSGSGSVYRLPWPDASGDIRLRDVDVRTLSNPEQLSGPTARILVEPGDSGGHLTGAAPVGHYVRTQNGTMIPADYVTLVGATVYAHQERLRDLDEKVGADGFLNWPLTLGVEVRITGKDGLVQNNAIYDAKFNSLLIVPYTEGNLPPSISPGILAHEHFHFLFQKIVLSQTPDRGSQTGCNGIAAAPSTSTENEKSKSETSGVIPARIFNNYLLRAMNEGFADYWGWLYSHDEHFVAKSLPGEDDRRRLDWGSGRLATEDMIREDLIDPEDPTKIIDEQTRAGKSYYLGTSYARFLRKIVRDLVKSGLTEDDAKMLVAKALIKSLPALAAEVASKYGESFLSPNVILKPLIMNLPKMTQPACASVEEFRAIEAGYEKPSSCRSFNSPPESPREVKP